MPPGRVAQWLAYLTRALEVTGSILGWGEHFFGRFFPLPLTSDLCEKVVSGLERMLCKYWCGRARKTWVGAALTAVIWPKLLKAALNYKQTNKSNDAPGVKIGSYPGVRSVTKIDIVKTLKIFSPSRKFSPGLPNFVCSIIYQDCSNNAPWIKISPSLGVRSFT